MTRNRCRSDSGTKDQSTESASEEDRRQEGCGQDQVCSQEQEASGQDGSFQNSFQNSFQDSFQNTFQDRPQEDGSKDKG